MRRLVLFDVDGTLLWPNGAGRASMQAALLRVYGTAGAIESYRFAGKTDRATVRQLMEGAHIAPDLIWSRFEQLGDVMAQELRRLVAERKHNIQPCPGAHELVEALSTRSDVVLGLLTGNFCQTALIKIEAAGFDPSLFQVGAYGQEAEQRSDLPPLAVQRASALTGKAFIGQQVAIIGDTPDDITCGRGIGARSIAVLTGWCDRAVLESASPHYLFDDLSDTQAVLAAIFAPVDRH